MSKEKKNKSIVVATRLKEDEYADVMLRIVNEHGEQIMKPSDYFKQSLLDAKVVVKDKEVEQYRAFILSRISNNMNQVAKRLNQDNLANKISEETYKSVLSELVKINKEINELAEPVR
jgi:hypothetical protein